nr:hypothetical protein [Tanacetum cinerariifolium]
TTSEGSAKKKGRTVAVTTEDMQKRRNDTFGGNKATKKTKKNQLKQQYGNFKAEGSETLEQTFNRLQAIISHMEFMDVEIEQDDLNQKFLTSLAPKWLMYTIMWRNRGDLDTMSLDDVYNHLKVYEPEVQKKSESNSQNMAFISSAKNSSGNGEIKYEDINQIDEDDIEEMDIKWNIAFLSMRADRFWKKTGKKISIQCTDVASFDKSKVEYFNYHKMGHFARECRDPRSQDRGRKENYRQGSKEEEQAPKALMAIDRFGKKFLMKNKACFNCGDFDHLSYDYGKWVEKGKSRPKNNTHKSIPPRTIFHKSDRSPTRTTRPNMNVAQPKRTSFYKPAHSYVKRPFQRRSAVRTQFQVLKVPTVSKNFPTITQKFPTGNSRNNKGYWDNGCFRHMTGNISYFSDYEPYDEGTPKQHNMYSIDLNNVVPHKDLTCLVAKASADESMLWHRRLGHLNFKTMNRFTWTFFLKTKDETSGILRNFITEIENLKELKNRVAERRYKTLIEAARTMLADAKLPVTFWAEAVNTACYVQNRVLVNKS